MMHATTCDDNPAQRRGADGWRGALLDHACHRSPARHTCAITKPCPCEGRAGRAPFPSTDWQESPASRGETGRSRHQGTKPRLAPANDPTPRTTRGGGETAVGSGPGAGGRRGHARQPPRDERPRRLPAHGGRAPKTGTSRALSSRPARQLVNTSRDPQAPAREKGDRGREHARKVVKTSITPPPPARMPQERRAPRAYLSTQASIGTSRCRRGPRTARNPCRS